MQEMLSNGFGALPRFLIGISHVARSTQSGQPCVRGSDTLGDPICSRKLVGSGRNSTVGKRASQTISLRTLEHISGTFRYFGLRGTGLFLRLLLQSFLTGATTVFYLHCGALRRELVNFVTGLVPRPSSPATPHRQRHQAWHRHVGSSSRIRGRIRRFHPIPVFGRSSKLYDGVNGRCL
jgi:hypothetical protein